MSWCQSGHWAVNFSARCGFQYLWDSSQDIAQNIVRSPGGRARRPCPCFITKRFSLVELVSPFLHFFFPTSLRLKLTLWLKFFHRQETAEGYGGQAPFQFGSSNPPYTQQTVCLVLTFELGVQLTWLGFMFVCSFFFQRSPPEPSCQAHSLMSTGSLFQNGRHSRASLHGFPLLSQSAGLKDTW